jgi:hypothetical protein
MTYNMVTIHNRLIDFMYGNFLIDKSYHTYYVIYHFVW